MKKNSNFLMALVIGSSLLAGERASAQKVQTANPPPAPPPPPPVSVVNPPAAPQPPYVYDQKLASGGAQALVTPEQAKALVERFKAGYPALGSPRLVIFVNRELIDQNTGMRMIARTEKIESGTNSQAKVSSENRYRLQERTALSLADKQTLRDVERLFGRPLRLGGAVLADQRLATQLMPDGLPQSLATEGDQARKDREALAKIADVAVEILISSKNIIVPEVSGDKTYVIPDIQATAMRLKDARIMAQASSADVTGRLSPAMVKNYSVQEVAETTALALMEDMLTGVDVAAKTEPAK